MRKYLLTALIEILFSRLSPELLRKVVDALLDRIEDAIEESETQTDDALIMPLVALVRESFSIPDNDADDDGPFLDPTVPMNP